MDYRPGLVSSGATLVLQVLTAEEEKTMPAAWTQFSVSHCAHVSFLG